jgi:heat shock protein HslJ
MKRLIGPVAFVVLTAACGGVDVSEPTSGSSSAPPSSTAATTATTAAAQGVDAPELGGTSWNVTMYSLPNGALTNVWKTDVTIAFGDDGRVAGSAGCNTYEATWAVSGAYDEFESGVRDANDGQELTLSSLAWTEIGCEDEAIMEQEAEILDLLQRGARWVLVRGNFNLRDADGGFLFEAEPA